MEEGFAYQVALMAGIFALGVLAGWFFACVLGRRRGGPAAKAAAGGSPASGLVSAAGRVVELQDKAARAAADAREAYQALVSQKVHSS
jgi:hypothetical protein